MIDPEVRMQEKMKPVMQWVFRGTFVLFLFAWGFQAFASSVEENCQFKIPPRQAASTANHGWIVLLHISEGGEWILQRLSDHVG